MKLSNILASNLASRMILVHPPEPRKELLLSSPSKAVYIGRSKYANVPVFWDPSRLINPHIAIIGITGSGKSYFLKSFLTRASLIWNSNVIILDWVGEYSKWIKQAGGKTIDLKKEKLNLFDLSHSSKPMRIKQIISAFDTLSNLKQFPNEREEIEEALEDVFKKIKSPHLSDVVSLLDKRNKKTSSRILKRFLDGNMDFFSGRSSTNIKKLASSGLVSIDLHNLPTEEMRSLAGLTILQYIKELMRSEPYDEKKGIRLFVVLDEAWKIASSEDSDVIDIVREGRKYNFALIVASQNPTDIHKTIFSNVGSLFVLRLVLQEYRKYVQDSVGYSSFISSAISRFGVGDCAINMIFSEKQAKSTTFLLNKIEGEEPLFLYHLKIEKYNGGFMEIEIDKDQFVHMLFEQGLDDGQVSLVKSEFEKSDGIINGEKLVFLFEKFGFSKSSIISFLRQLGVSEKNIIHIFSLVKIRSAKKGIVGVIVED